MTIYSIGYQRLRPSDLVAIMDELKVHVLVDVRSVSRSRHPGFGQRQLEALLGPSRYIWAGETLGGRGLGPTPAGYDWLEVYRPPLAPNVLLMCQEEAPGDCHRHRMIAVELLKRGVDVIHVYQEMLIKASDLQVAIKANSIPPVSGLLKCVQPPSALG